jgi:TPR repeat protein
MEHTFGNMPVSSPVILINATQYNSQGIPWVFSDQSMRHLGSRLDTYPVADAVMASAAFPGAFHNVTLVDHRSRLVAGVNQYLHLYDAGVSDNLGIVTLIQRARSYQGLKGCMFFLIDAYPFNFLTFQKGNDQASTVQFIDRFLDTNALDASDVLLKKQRELTLRQLGLDREAQKSAFQEFPLTSSNDSREPPLRCGVWHISLERSEPRGDDYIASKPEFPDPVIDDESLREDIYTLVNHIDTRFVLTSPLQDDPVALQNALFLAAGYSIDRNTAVRKKVCAWFQRYDVSVSSCTTTPPTDVSALLEWHRYRSSKGSGLSALSLGSIYEEGKLVERNCSEAARWYRLAAERGDAGGETKMGMFYFDGRCPAAVPKDTKEGTRLLREAAEQGLSVAQLNLGSFYEDGEGVPQDFVQAYLWYSLAAAREREGFVYAALLRRRMTPEQISEAAKLVQEWKPKPRAQEPPLFKIEPTPGVLERVLIRSR